MSNIDYAWMKRAYPRQKAALTRASKKSYNDVLVVCIAAVTEWDSIGAWPDDWSRWQRALIDAANKHHRETGVFVNVPRLENFSRN
jgi:hypothetical protein